MQCSTVHCDHPGAAPVQEACSLTSAATLQDMDAKQKSITELTETVKETGETVRQLQAGEPCSGATACKAALYCECVCRHKSQC